MKFIELTVHTTTEASEIIADIMWNYTNYGVTICDVNDIIALQKSKDTMYWDYMDDDLTAAQPKDVLVKCYIAEDIAEKTVGEIMRDVADAKEMSGGALPFGTLEDTKREVDRGRLDRRMEKAFSAHSAGTYRRRARMDRLYARSGRKDRSARFEYGFRHGRARNHFHVHRAS